MEISEYIQAFKVNDYSHFDEFYNLTSKQVYFTALGILKDRSLSEDIVQDTYVSFLESIDSCNENTNIYGYLTVIARNKAINIYNKHKKEELDNEYIENVAHVTEDHHDRVNEILSLLEDKDERELIVYHVILEYSFKEISEIIGKPLGTVIWKYNKAIKKLRERMENYED